MFEDELRIDPELQSLPITLMVGDRSTAASQAISRAVAKQMPACLVEASGLAHMAPLTHPRRVYEEIARHFQSLLARNHE